MRIYDFHRVYGRPGTRAASGALGGLVLGGTGTLATHLADLPTSAQWVAAGATLVLAWSKANAGARVGSALTVGYALGDEAGRKAVRREHAMRESGADRATDQRGKGYGR